MREMIKYYPIPEEEDTKDKAFLAYNVLIGTSLDKELCFAFEVLDYVLLGTSGAPVKQAILDAGLAKDVFGGYDSDLYQPFFSIIGKDANYEDKDKYIKVVREALEKVVKEGVDKKALKAAINTFTPPISSIPEIAAFVSNKASFCFKISNSFSVSFRVSKFFSTFSTKFELVAFNFCSIFFKISASSFSKTETSSRE